jgi:hypothetical protein
LDDGGAPGNGLESDTLTISATVFDDDTQSATTSRLINVSNVAPTVALNPVGGVSENSTATLTGSFTDVGVLDAHTVTVNWGDLNEGDSSTFLVPAIQTPAGASTFPVGSTFNSTTDNAVLTITSIDTTTGQVGFSVAHKYLDDGLAPGNSTESDSIAISAIVADDDSGSGSSTRLATLNNTSPSLTLNTPAGYFVNAPANLTGSYTDIGLLDQQSLVVAWGDSTSNSTFLIDSIQDASGAATLSVGDTFNSSTDSAVLTITSIDTVTGQVGFSVGHQYTSIGTKTITVDIADDDLGVDSESINVTVNEPPIL